MSATIATIGVAMKGKPNPSAPWIRPASNTAVTTHSITASEKDSIPGMATTVLKNIPSPRVNGERAGVRGNQLDGFHKINERDALPPHPSPLPQPGARGLLK